MTPSQKGLLSKLNQIRAALVTRGEEVIDLCMINPDLPPPRILLDKLVEATIKPQNHRYAVSRGVRKLREGFQSKYQKAFGVTLDPESEICVTMGAKDGVYCAMLAVKELGLAKSVLVGRPTYPAYLGSAALAGLSVDFFDLSASEDEMYAELQQKLSAMPGRLLLLNFPNNPTGVSVSATFWSRVCDLATRTNSVVLNDFVYGEMHFGAGSAASALAQPSASAPIADCLIECYSMSKAYGIPGWRVAAMLGAKDIVSRIASLKGYLDYGLFLPLQYAAAYALSLNVDLVSEARSEYHSRVLMFSEGLRKLGFQVRMPCAGASLWVTLGPATKDPGGGFAQGQSISQMMLEAGVFAMPGELFGAEYENWVRFAMVQEREKLCCALDKLANMKGRG